MIYLAGLAGTCIYHSDDLIPPQPLLSTCAESTSVESGRSSTTFESGMCERVNESDR